MIASSAARAPFVAGFAAALVAAAPTSASAVAVDLELSLGIDVSGSVDDSEFDLQIDGYRAAFERTDIGSLIANTPNGIAVNAIFFASSAEEVLPYTHLQTAADAAAFGAALDAVDRDSVSVGFLTDIEDSVELSIASFINNGFEGDRLAIDISGDGTSSSRLVQEQRDLAAAAGITINGLAIESRSTSTRITDFYEENLITSDGFAVTSTFDTFSDAITRKLGAEISDGDPDDPIDPSDPSDPGDPHMIPTPTAAMAGLLGLGFTALRRRKD